jgi:hypothetical protein
MKCSGKSLMTKSQNPVAILPQFQDMITWPHCFGETGCTVHHSRGMWGRGAVHLIAAWKQREREGAGVPSRACPQ